MQQGLYRVFSSMTPLDMFVDNIQTITLVICLVIGVAIFFHGYRSEKQMPTVLKQNAKVIDFNEYPLIEKQIISHDTRKFTFGLPVGYSLGLPTGQHLTLKYIDKDGKPVQRSYTPTSDNDVLGKVEFVIKVYKAGVHPKFPEGGKMSQHLDSLKLGDKILMKGPKGHLEWLGQGNFKVKPLGKPKEVRHCDCIGMIAGGTGITPMLQVLNAIFKNPADQTKVKLLYANQTEEDILVREELEHLAETYPERFQLHYTLDRPPDNWMYSSGFVTKKMMEGHLLFEPGLKQQFMMCGPPPMLKFACYPALKEMGFSTDDWNVF